MAGDLLKFDIPNTASVDAPQAVLLPYQQRWIADTAQLKVIEKSRRTGLTWAEAADDVTIAAKARDAGGQNVYYIGYSMDMAIEYIEACAMWAKVLHGITTTWEEGEEVFTEGKVEKAIKTYTIHFASGFRIVALSSRPANMRGKQGVVVIDEAAFHNDLGELIKAALALLIWGGKVRVISTHDGDGNPFNELVNEIRSGARAGSVHRITFQEAIAEGLYRRVCMRLRKPWTPEGEAEWTAGVYKFYGDGALEELDVIPSQGTGAWLSAALIEARMTGEAPVLRITARKGFEQEPAAVRHAEIQQWLDLEVGPVLAKLDPRLQSFLGEDFGRTGDLTDIVLGQIDQQLNRRVACILELRNMPHAQQTQILNYCCDRLPRFTKAAVDARGNGNAVAEFLAQRYGFSRVELVMLTETWYREQMPPLKRAFEDATISLCRDADVLNDLRMIKVIRGVARVPDQRGTGKDGGQRHGDSAVALALWHYATRTLSNEFEWQAIPSHPRGFDNVRDRADLDDDIHLPEPSAW